MGLVESIVEFFKKRKAGEVVTAPEGICPNCWGSQEYAGVIREIEKDIQVDVNASSTKQAFIQEFVTKHIDGIKLKNKLEGLTCDKCKVVYPHEHK